VGVCDFWWGGTCRVVSRKSKVAKLAWPLDPYGFPYPLDVANPSNLKPARAEFSIVEAECKQRPPKPARQSSFILLSLIYLSFLFSSRKISPFFLVPPTASTGRELFLNGPDRLPWLSSTGCNVAEKRFDPE
jgi:hypothetical protein